MSLETHIVKAYTQEIAHLTTMIAEMGGYSQAAVAEAMQALRRRDSAQAMRVVEGDRKIDSLEAQISGYVVRLLALRQPMANDLCTIVAGLKIAGDLERIGDYAKNNAKHVIELNKSPVAGPIAGVGNLGRMVELMLDEVLDAYVVGDATAAETVRARDEDVDDVHTGLFRELVNCMTENSRTVTSCTRSCNQYRGKCGVSGDPTAPCRPAREVRPNVVERTGIGPANPRAIGSARTELRP